MKHTFIEARPLANFNTTLLIIAMKIFDVGPRAAFVRRYTRTEMLAAHALCILNSAQRGHSASKRRAIAFLSAARNGIVLYLCKKKFMFGADH